MQRVCTRRLQVVPDVATLVPLVDGQLSALLLARAAAEEALRAAAAVDQQRPAHMQRIIGAPLAGAAPAQRSCWSKGICLPAARARCC